MIRHVSILLLTILSISVSPLNAAEPLLTIGKPYLDDIAYTPDGRFLATLSTPYPTVSVELLDAETFVPVHRIDTVEGEYLRFSPDSSQLAIFGDRANIQLWDVAPPRLRATIPVKTVHATFSPDGTHLAYTVDDTVYLWHLREKQVVMALTNGAPITAIEFHPNLSILISGHQEGPVTFWDVNTGQIQRRFPTALRHPKKLRFSPNGEFLGVLLEHTDVYLFETATGALWESSDSALDFGFSSDSTYFFIGTSGAMLQRLHIPTGWWDGQSVVDEPMEGRRMGRVKRLTFHPDGDRFASQINSYRISIWDVKMLSRLKTLSGWAQTSTRAAYLPKINRLVTGFGTNILHFWDTRTGDLLKTVAFHSRLYQVVPSPDGRSVALDVEATNQIWDAALMEPRHVFQIRGYLGTQAVNFSPSGKYLASNTYRGTFIWEVETGRQVNLIDTGWSDFSLLLFTPDERQIVLIPPNDEDIQPAGDFIGFWDIQTGARVRSVDSIGPLLFERNNFLQVRDSQEVLEIFDMASDRELSQIPKPIPFQLIRRFSDIRFHPTGRMVAVRWPVRTTPDKQRFYDTRTGQLLAVIPGADLRFAGKGEFLLLHNENSAQLEIYRTQDIVNVPESAAVEPQARQLAQWGTIKKNALLQNFPNPFNPETWIPFRLSTESHVTIYIYSPTGQLVRRLSLGSMPAGDYSSQSQAIHWNGRNQTGEPVSSGVYLYTIDAGDFSATRKMIIRK